MSQSSARQASRSGSAGTSGCQWLRLNRPWARIIGRRARWGPQRRRAGRPPRGRSRGQWSAAGSGARWRRDHLVRLRVGVVAGVGARAGGEPELVAGAGTGPPRRSSRRRSRASARSRRPRVLVHGASRLMIESNGAEVRLSWMPAWAKLDLSACISSFTWRMPLAYCSEKLRGVPAAMPGPQWPAPDPGDVQVVTPLGLTAQPWLDSSLTAVAGGSGHGPRRRVDVGVGRDRRDRAVVGVAETLQRALEVRGLVDERLHGLPEVGLRDDRPGLRALEVIRK